MQTKIVNFGDRLRIFLREHKTGRQDFANLLGVSLNTVGSWIRNEKQPTLDKIRMIAHYYNVDLTWLITGEQAGEYAARRELSRVNDATGAYRTKRTNYRDLLKKFDSLSDDEKRLVIDLVERLAKK